MAEAETPRAPARLADERGYVFVHPYANALVMAGQGDDRARDAGAMALTSRCLVVPIGGGGLASGGGGWAAKGARAGDPSSWVSRARLYPSFRNAIHGERLPVGRRDAGRGGCAVKRPGGLTLPIVREPEGGGSRGSIVRLEIVLVD